MNFGRIFKIASHPYLGLAYLAAVTENAGYDVSVIDAATLNMSDNEILVKLRNLNPNVIGITTNILLGSWSLKLGEIIRRQFPEAKLVFGGPWASAVYEMLLREKICDFVVVGEGEQAFIDLLKKIEEGQIPKNIPGIAYVSKNDSVELESPRPLENLDEIPFPAWHLFPSAQKYFFSRRGKILYPVMTSRGCPYHCNYCTRLIHGHRMRYRSIQNVIDEIRYLKERFSIDEIAIIDDNFTLNKKRAEHICDEIIKNQFNISIQFSNGIRADTVDKKLIRKLKQAGTWKIGIGVESGNQDVVNKIGKSLDLNAVRRAAQIIKQEKIILFACFIIGLPFDTVKTMNDTINFAIEIDPDYGHFYIATAFPGTELYNQVKRDGKFLMSLHDIDRGYNVGSPNFEIYDLKVKEVDRLFKQAYRRFYLRPRKILSLLLKLRTLNEVKYFLNYGIISILNILNLDHTKLMNY